MRAAFPASATHRTTKRRPLAGKTAPRPCARWPAPPACHGVSLVGKQRRGLARAGLAPAAVSRPCCG